MNDNIEYYYYRESYVNKNLNNFPKDKKEQVTNIIYKINTQQYISLTSTIRFIKPKDYLIESIFLGPIGEDRLELNQPNACICKFLLCFCGIGLIWWLYDIFTAMHRVKKYNYNILKQWYIWNNFGI